jgi:TolB protein
MSRVKRLIVALTLVFGLGMSSAGSSAPGEAVALNSNGRLVFSCSGCPGNLSGPSVYVVRSTGTEFREIETPALSPYGPRWSPSGRRISISSHFADIWTIDPNGGSRRRLTHACVECDYPPAAWSPDGKRLVFARRGVLFTMRSDGTRERRLFGRWRRSFSEPDWSPDGKRLAFGESGTRLHVIRADGKRFRQLRRVKGRYPRWSPNGRWIAFIAFGGRETGIGIVRSDGTHPRYVARNLPVDISSSPTWSPDGRRVAFAVTHSFNDYEGHELMVASLDGAPPQPIVIPELPPDARSDLHGLDWH